MKTKILILVNFFLILNCTNDSISQVTNIGFTEIARGFLKGDGAEGITKQNIVIYNDTEWNDLKTKMNLVNNETDSFSETNIDFSEFLIVAAFEEVRYEGEHFLSITEIVQTSENIFVKTKLETPSSTNAIQVVTQPYYIAKIQKNDLPIVFE